MMSNLICIIALVSTTCFACGQLNYDALETAASEGDIGALRRCLKAGLNPSGRPSLPNLPILLAIYHGHREVVRILLDAGISPNFGWGPDGGNLLTNAIQAKNVEVIKILVSKGADVNSNGPNRSALYRAELEGDEQIKQLLIEKGARFRPHEIEILNSLSPHENGGEIR